MKIQVIFEKIYKKAYSSGGLKWLVSQCKRQLRLKHNEIPEGLEDLVATMYSFYHGGRLVKVKLTFQS